MLAEITIEYCVNWHFKDQAAGLAAELLALYEKKINSITIIPSTVIGDFEVKCNKQIVFSKRVSGRLPNQDEVEQLLAAQLFGGK